MQYDYHSCPYEPDTGVPPCGKMAECKTCTWCSLAATQATTAIIFCIKFKLCASSIKSACHRMTK